MKTLVTVHEVVEADMVGVRLRARGIPFFAKDLYTSSVLPWGMASCIGGIDIQVSDEDYERAQAALAEDPLPDDEIGDAWRNGSRDVQQGDADASGYDGEPDNIGDAWRNGSDYVWQGHAEDPRPDGTEALGKPRPSWKKRIAIDLAIICVGQYLLVCAFGLFKLNDFMFHPHEEATYAWDTPHIVNIGTAADPIAAMWLPNAETNKVFLYSHGNAEDIGDLTGILRDFQQAGLSVLAYDYPGYGLSAGKPTEQSVYAAAETAYRFLTQNLQIAPSDIIALGRSIGSGPACYLAEKFPVGGLVVEGGFTSAPRVITRIRILPFDPFPNIRRLPNIFCPVLVIHGKVDNTVSFSHGKALFDAAHTPKERLWVDSGHNDLLLVLGDDYFTVLDRFATQIQKEPK